MKKILFFTLILFLLVSSPFIPVFAATPPIPTPAKYVDPFEIEGCEDKTQVCHFIENHTSDKGELSKPLEQALGTFAQAQPVLKFAGIDITSVIKLLGTVNPADAYKVTTDILNSFSNQIHDAADTDLNSHDFQKAQKENDQPCVYSKNGILCIRNPQTGESLGQYKAESIWDTVSGNMPEYCKGVDGASLFVSMFGGRWQKYDFTHPKTVIKKLATPQCGDKPNEGQNIEQKPLSFEKTNTYGEQEPIEKSFVWQPDDKNITETKNDDGTFSYAAHIGVPVIIVQGGYKSHIDQYGCEYGRCTTKDLAEGGVLAAVGSLNPEQKRTLVSDGSAVGLYLTHDQAEVFDKKLPDMSNAQEYAQTLLGGGQNVTWTSNNKLENRIYEAGCEINNAIRPHDDPKVCISPTPSPAGNCPIDQIAAGTFKPKDATCKLGHADLFKGFVQGAYGETGQIPNGLPPLAQKVLDAAAGTFHVPSSILLATMINEGAFSSKLGWKWADDAAVQTYSDCKKPDPMPTCQGRNGNGATGPFGFLMTSSDWNNPEVQNAIFKAFPNRPKTNVSPCNFVDAAFASAWALSSYDSHLRYTDLPISCNGTTIYRGTDPSFLDGSCSVWSPERAALSRLQYAEHACVPAVDITVDMFKAMSGGGSGFGQHL